MIILFSGILLSGCSVSKMDKKVVFENISSSNLKYVGKEYSSFFTDGKRIFCYEAPKQEELNNNDFVSIDGKSYGRIIKNVDFSKFKIIDNYFAKDDTTVYYNCQPIAESDPKTYKLLSKGYGFGVDKNNVYRLTKKINSADPKTFTSLGDDYSKDKQNVYYLNEKVEGSDPISFFVLSNNYSKDKNNVYYFGKKIFGADPKTFTNLGKEYFKDVNNVYFEGKLVEGMDPKTSSFLGYMYYAKDKNLIYYNGQKIEGSDAKSFRYFGSYIRDKTGIYVERKRINNFDEKTLKYIGFQFYKDKNNIYMNGVVFSSDVDGFQLIDKRSENGNNYYVDVYTKDKGQVYYGSKYLENLDPATIKYFLDNNNNPSVTDGHCTYRMDTLVGCN